jgi:hypothetical protein
MKDGNSGQNIDRRRCAQSCVRLLDRVLARKHTKEESSVKDEFVERPPGVVLGGISVLLGMVGLLILIIGVFQGL